MTNKSILLDEYFRMGYVLWGSGHGHSHGGLPSASHGHSHGDGKGSHSHGHSHGGSHGHSHGISDSTPLNVRAALIHVFGDLLQVSLKD